MSKESASCCEVCGRYLAACTCPNCPVCGARANTTCQANHTYRTTRVAVLALLERHGGKVLKLAKTLGINNTHIYVTINDKATPTTRRKMQELGYIRQKRGRFRLAAEFENEAERDNFLAQLNGQSFTDWVKEKRNVSES